MKLRSYIKEGKEPTLRNVLVMLYNDCKPYIHDLIKGGFQDYDNFMYSGRSETKDIIKKSVRKNRKPKDTDEDIHDSLNREFKERFGYNVRSETIFATGSMTQANEYGNRVYCIFPIGKYEVIWSPEFTDLYTVVGTTYNIYTDNYYYMKANNKDFDEKKFIGEMDKLSFYYTSRYKRGDILKAIRSH